MLSSPSAFADDMGPTMLSRFGDSIQLSGYLPEPDQAMHEARKHASSKVGSAFGLAGSLWEYKATVDKGDVAKANTKALSTLALGAGLSAVGASTAVAVGAGIALDATFDAAYYVYATGPRNNDEYNKWLDNLEERQRQNTYASLGSPLGPPRLSGENRVSIMGADAFAKVEFVPKHKCGSMEYYNQVGVSDCVGEEPQQPQQDVQSLGWADAATGQCGFPGVSFEQVADIIGGKAFGCQMVKRTPSGNEIRYVLNCGGMLAGAIFTKVSDTQINYSMGYEGSGGYIQRMLVRCSSQQAAQADCSPTGMDAWRALHPGQVNYQCGG